MELIEIWLLVRSGGVHLYFLYNVPCAGFWTIKQQKKKQGQFRELTRQFLNSHHWATCGQI